MKTLTPETAPDWFEIMRIFSASRSRALQKRCGVGAYPEEVLAEAARAAVATKDEVAGMDAVHDVILAWEREHTLEQEVTH